MNSALRDSVFRRPLRLSLVAILFLVFASADAQNGSSEEGSISSFVDSVAKGIYNLAWPTAKYREVSLNGFERAPGCYNIYVKISGNGAFDDSDLWLRLVILLRNGSISDVKVQDDNHFLVAPFQTLIATGTLASELAKESARDTVATPTPSPAAPAPRPLPTPGPRPYTPAPVPQAPPAPPASPTSDTTLTAAQALCIENHTQRKIVFSYRWGSRTWNQVNQDPQMDEAVWRPFDPASGPAPQLVVSFDGDFAPGVQSRTYTLPTIKAALPISRGDTAEYRFGITGTALRLYNTDSTEVAQ